MNKNTVSIRFYEELNDFLPHNKKKETIRFDFNGNPAVKDVIESLGIPHTEVDLILVNENSVGFDYQLQQGDHISVYPVFESMDISSINRLRSKPLRIIKFILDVHLGKLARQLRMLGFDALYRNDYLDPEIVEISVRENRVILTRDIGIFKTKAVTHGYWLRSTNPEEQIEEVIKRFDLAKQIKPFHRCMVCNGAIKPVAKDFVLSLLEPDTAQAYEEFYQCVNCDKIYWKGSHFQKMKKLVRQLSDLTVN